MGYKGQTDGAAIDSNALLNQLNQNQIDASEFTILENLGPFPNSASCHSCRYANFFETIRTSVLTSRT